MWQAYATKLLPRGALARFFRSSQGSLGLRDGTGAAKRATTPRRIASVAGGQLRQPSPSGPRALALAEPARPWSPLLAMRSVQTQAKARVVRLSPKTLGGPKRVELEVATSMAVPLVDRATGHCNSKLVLSTLDYIGSALFAFTGCLKAAVVAQMDVLGCCLVGFTTAAGGGTVRDLLLGQVRSSPPAHFGRPPFLRGTAICDLTLFPQTPVFWMKSPQYILLAVITSLATFFFYPTVRSHKGLTFDETEQVRATDRWH